MEKKILIELRHPQPLPCPKCGGKYGYKVSDSYSMSYTADFSADGVYESGEYSDGRLIHKGIRAFCANCLNILPFKIKRVSNERFE